ncbi:MAG: 3-phosphoglycerate dehydrogenase [Oscillospiraceae bacterium]|nr:3-phosphoglycerate dehydrogenase [Oscillospiraceae bacterium]
MYNIKLLNNIAAAGVAQLDKACVVGEDAPDGIIVRSADMTEYAFGPELCAIARAGAGFNNIPVDRCSEEGIVVFNTPGANANAVRELVLCALLISSRRIIDAVEWCKTLAGDPDAETKVEKGKSQFVGPELAGKTLGIIGLGHVGVIVANAAVDLGMNVLGYDPYLSLENAWGMARRVQRASSYDEIYEKADYITIHAPLNDSTRGMISAETIAKMKYGVRIINLARGGLVNNDDMKQALASGKVGRYVTDFPSGDIIGFENVIALPHLGASTPESEENCAVMAAKQISDYLLTGNIVNSVNYPNIVQPLNTAHRITVLHRNIPNIISYATGIIGAQGINIEHLYTTARGNYAYMMIDTNVQPDAEAIEKLKQNDGILRVRVL